MLPHALKQHISVLVSGYIRPTLSGSPQHDTFPADITLLIASYVPIEFTFYQQQHGDFMSFVTPSNVKMSSSASGWSTCLIQAFALNAISARYCDECRIQFVWKCKSSSVILGFVFAESIEQCDIDWNKSIGNNVSLGLMISSNSVYLYYRPTEKRTRLQHVSRNYGGFQSNDKLELRIDFVLEKVTLYHNGVESCYVHVDIGMQSIIPALSMFKCFEKVEITHSEFVWKQNEISSS